MAYRTAVLHNIYRLVNGQDIKEDDAKTWVEQQVQQLGHLPLYQFHMQASRLAPAGSYNNLLRWDLDAAALTSLAEELMASTKASLDAVAAVPEGQHTWQNTLQPLADDEAMTAALHSCCDFPHHVSESKELRDASSDADQKLSAFGVECGMRTDVYESVQKYKERYEAALALVQQGGAWPEGLRQHTAEEQRFLDRQLRDFRRNGLHLPAEARERIKALKTRMSDLGIQFSKNLGEENTTYELDPEQLQGMSQDFISSRPKTENGKVIVDLKYPCVFPILKLCKVPETRALLEKGFNSRCKEQNTPIIEELVRLRAEMAALLGFANHATYILDIRMAKTPQTVTSFLNDLSSKLDPLAEREKNILLALKQQECEARGLPFDNTIHPYDFQYYLNKRMEQEFQVDHEAIKKYFPLQVVTQGLLTIYQRLLGLRFEEVAHPHVWHPDVQLFSVYDSQSQELVGQFYLDMFPRPGKYGHAACFGIQPACQIDENTWQTPAAACVCNFPKPTSDKPSLLRHEDVETFFHEFGHVMHQLCSKARFARFAGTRVERDFVEAPSQMLENWCWEKESLLMMSGHYEHPEQKLPDELLNKLVAAKDANVALLTKRQIVFGLLDQTMHSQSEVDSAALYAELQRRVVGIQATPDTNMVATFGHLAGGYDASYYGYLWSEVYCMDMFATKFEQNLLDPEAGMQYRKCILECGGSIDAAQMLLNFLGREPSPAAFLKSKGLEL